MFKKVLFLIVVLTIPQFALAGVATSAAREAAKQVMHVFRKEVGKETAETLTEKIIILSAKHGDDAVIAVKKIGPKTFQLVEKAGTQGDDAVKLLAKHGDNAILIIEKPQALNLFSQYGDDVAEAMIKHKGGSAVTFIEKNGIAGAKALKSVDGQNARRLMSEDFAKLGRTDEYLAVVEKFGNKGSDFIWRNKGALVIGTVATTFLLNPQPFIDGVKKLEGDVIETIGDNILSKLPWTLITIIVAGFLAVRFRIWRWLPKKKKKKTDVSA